MAWDGAQWNTLLPADFRPLRSPGPGTAEDWYLAHSAAELADCLASGAAPGRILLRTEGLTAEELSAALGRCCPVAGSVEELGRVGRAAQTLARPGLIPVGLLLRPEGGQEGIPPEALAGAAGAARRLDAISVQGCLIAAPEREDLCALARRLRAGYELAKRMTVLFPCSMPYLCYTGVSRTLRAAAEAAPSERRAFLTAAETVAMQNRTAFYARLLFT